MKRITTRLAQFAWFLLAYNIAVIVFGAFVRATGSGAGCGSHWPLCNGVVIPQAPAIETVIEFSHRLTSGLTLVLVVLLLVWVRRSYPKSKPLSWSTGLALFFTLTEALIGAGLVLFKLVNQDASFARAISMMAHLVNTFLLLASISVTAWWLTYGVPVKPIRSSGRFWIAGLGAVGLLILGASGAIAALGDTLFPSTSLTEALQQDISSSANSLLRLRILHPVIAIVAGLLAIKVGLWLADGKPNPASGKFAHLLTALVLLQLGLGGLNVILLAPVWMQLIHLAVTSIIWICYVLVCVTSLFLVDFSTGVVNHEIEKRVNGTAAQ